MILLSHHLQWEHFWRSCKMWQNSWRCYFQLGVLRMLAMYLLRLYRGEPLYETIGRIGTPGLCIFAFCLCFSIILCHLMTVVVLFRCCSCIWFCNVLLFSSITLVILPISFFAALVSLLVVLFSKSVLRSVNVITELNSIKDIFIFGYFVRFL